MSNGHTKSRKQIKITPDNSIDKSAIPIGVPCTYLSCEGILGTEREGYVVMFVVEKTIYPSEDGQKPHIDIKPIRNSIREYLVIVCRKK